MIVSLKVPLLKKRNYWRVKLKGQQINSKEHLILQKSHCGEEIAAIMIYRFVKTLAMAYFPIHVLEVDHLSVTSL